MNKKSGLELMRIVSMFFIILYHIILHSGLIDSAVGGSKFLLVLLESLLIVHVNSFILLTGYFQSDKDARLSKVISIFNMTWFYKILCIIGIYILVNYFSFNNEVEMSFHQKLISFLPLDRSENWYINNYLLIYIFSPFINVLINKIDKNKFKKLIIITFIIFSLVGTLFIGSIIPIYGEGRSILTFILLYFVGAYLRKYPLEESRLFKKYTDKMKKYMFLTLYIILGLVVMLFRFTSLTIITYGPIYEEISNIFRLLSVSFLSPIVLLESITYFLFFKNMKFSSKIINFIGGTTFGIYLLHENIYIRSNLYNWLNMNKHANGGIKLIGMIIILGIIIFISCMIIEIIRKIIYKFFYKRKFAKKIRNRIIEFIKTLGLDINY